MSMTVLAAVAESACAVRVYLAKRPRDTSPIGGLRDALDRRSWAVSISSGSAKVPVVIEVVETRPEPEYPLVPAAWSVLLRVDRRLERESAYLVVGASELETADGLDSISAAPGDRATFSGIATARPLVRGARSAGVDLRYVGTRWTLDASGDVEGHSGPAAVRKRLERRMASSRGGFFHLPAYGLGLVPKKLDKLGERAVVTAEARRQVKLEPEVLDAFVEIRGGIPRRLFIRARLRGGSIEVTTR